MNNRSKDPMLPVTNQGPRPGDFPLGSVESRVAARAKANGKAEGKPVLRVVLKCMYECGLGKLPPELKPPVRYETEDRIIEVVERLAW